MSDRPVGVGVEERLRHCPVLRVEIESHRPQLVVRILAGGDRRVADIDRDVLDRDIEVSELRGFLDDIPPVFVLVARLEVGEDTEPRFMSYPGTSPAKYELRLMYRESPSSHVLVLYRRCRSSPSVSSPSSPTKFAPSGLTRGTIVIVRLSKIVSTRREPPVASRLRIFTTASAPEGSSPWIWLMMVEALVAVADRDLPDRVLTAGRGADLFKFDPVAPPVDLLEALAELLVVEIRLVVDRALVRRPRPAGTVVAARLCAHRGSEPCEADRGDTAPKEPPSVHTGNTRPEIV